MEWTLSKCWQALAFKSRFAAQLYSSQLIQFTDNSNYNSLSKPLMRASTTMSLAFFTKRKESNCQTARPTSIWPKKIVSFMKNNSVVHVSTMFRKVTDEGQTMQSFLPNLASVLLQSFLNGRPKINMPTQTRRAMITFIMCILQLRFNSSICPISDNQASRQSLSLRST